jgi:hypothetical protein
MEGKDHMGGLGVNEKMDIKCMVYEGTDFIY